MVKDKKKLFLFLRTIYDVGFFRIIGRIIFELGKFFDKLIYRFFILSYSQSDYLSDWKILDLDIAKQLKYTSSKEKYTKKKINLTILNKKFSLEDPINWNKVCSTRLDSFYLNYFDWSKELIIEFIKNKNQNSNLINKLPFLIDSWINFNSKNYGDGWHPYTVSLRIRNWIWIFHLIPNLVNEKRIRFLWIQFNWLNFHKETHLGGNHYLENLMSLVFTSLQFNNDKSERIFKKSIFKLENELNEQILSDGGHQERSSSYHLSILLTLTELACFLQIQKGYRPKWLILKINKMNNWATKIILNQSKYPRFNDSIFEDKLNIQRIIYFSKSYVEQKNFLSDNFSFENILISKLFGENKLGKNNSILYPLLTSFKKPHIDSLPETGWFIFRPSSDWEITFKCGVSGPKHLHGHAHADILSFDIFKNSKELIVETGTSTYEISSIRNYERSSESHNVMQFSDTRKTNIDDISDWSESVEVWSSFRAARKPKILSKSYGKDNNYLWAECTYKPFQRYLFSHQRILKMKIINENELQLEITDIIFSKCDIYWRSNIHLGPNQNKSILSKLYNYENNDLLSYKWYESWTSNKFGERFPSHSLVLYGDFKKGKNIKKFSLKLR